MEFGRCSCFIKYLVDYDIQLGFSFISISALQTMLFVWGRHTRLICNIHITFQASAIILRWHPEGLKMALHLWKAPQGEFIFGMRNWEIKENWNDMPPSFLPRVWNSNWQTDGTHQKCISCRIERQRLSCRRKILCIHQIDTRS